jgi:hypothetical protein
LKNAHRADGVQDGKAPHLRDRDDQAQGLTASDSRGNGSLELYRWIETHGVADGLRNGGNLFHIIRAPVFSPEAPLLLMRIVHRPGRGQVMKADPTRGSVPYCG